MKVNSNIRPHEWVYLGKKDGWHYNFNIVEKETEDGISYDYNAVHVARKETIKQALYDIGDGVKSEEIDNLLIALDASGMSVGVIILADMNEARTSLSDSAVSNLTDRGVTIITNGDEHIDKQFRVVHEADNLILAGEFTGATSVAYGHTGVDFDTEEEMNNYIAANNLQEGEIMSLTNLQIPICGKRGNVKRCRALVSGAIMVADKLVAITVENKYLVPYLPDSAVDTSIQGLVQLATFTGAQLVQYEGDDLKGTTTCLLNVDNITPTIFGQLQLLAAKIYVEWLTNHNLQTDGVLVEVDDWDVIAALPDLTWDKYSV